MTFDSATEVALSGQAWQNALNLVAQKRARLSSSSGLNADGTLATGEKGRLGSFYQGNLQSVMDEDGAERNDRKRGFGGMGGLAAKGQSLAHRVGLDRQAVNLRDTFDQFGQLTQEEQLANTTHTNEVGADGLGGTIGMRAAHSASDWLLEHPVVADPPTTTETLIQNPGVAALTPAQRAAMVITGTKSPAAAIKKNPTIFRTIKNNRY